MRPGRLALFRKRRHTLFLVLRRKERLEQAAFEPEALFERELERCNISQSPRFDLSGTAIGATCFSGPRERCSTLPTAIMSLQQTDPDPIADSASTIMPTPILSSTRSVFFAAANQSSPLRP